MLFNSYIIFLNHLGLVYKKKKKKKSGFSGEWSLQPSSTCKSLQSILTGSQQPERKVWGAAEKNHG